MTTVLAAGSAVVDFVFQLNEAPSRSEKHRARDATIVGGGCAANAAVAVSRLGGQAVLAARLGDDVIGDMILTDLDKEKVDCSLVRRFEGKRSSYSSVLVDPEGERSIVNFRDMEIDFSGRWLEEGPLPRFDAALADTRWPDGARAMMQLARQRGVPGIIDGEAPVREAEDALRLASHIAFSQSGLRDFDNTDDLEAALRRAGSETGAWVCVTMGADGVYWIEDDRFRHMPAFEVKAVDTLGAGDVWHGAFALMLARGNDEETAIRFASATSALKCTRFGGRRGTPTADEVEAFLMERA
ncbi:PfkB family carbohydrate kinase [Hoeflea prorocentri]|uniref:PfkB family carbohydrate kinase n=1 Tax=Hoeflea prorocentri TaxID=1922333 RepID=A0A9X3ZK62_9HYPH|nr:PfkB family carbohydrate kinase [Hoeflea prorocentri]MCY6383565.1 PfkB family carbohydrate kinase [Hoeflea prorocentri]MDA5401365.1 PfkB family carbohydrate kinase [Hoeflea prorocentri]